MHTRSDRRSNYNIKELTSLIGYSTNNSVGQSACVACLPGYATANLGSPNCSKCAPGMFSNTSGLAACYSCAPGKFYLIFYVLYFSHLSAQVQCPRYLEQLNAHHVAQGFTLEDSMVHIARGVFLQLFLTKLAK
jgi:hypothetical protein